LFLGFGGVHEGSLRGRRVRSRYGRWGSRWYNESQSHIWMSRM
jgi:hypothetical protein